MRSEYSLHNSFLCEDEVVLEYKVTSKPFGKIYWKLQTKGLWRSFSNVLGPLTFQWKLENTWHLSHLQIISVYLETWSFLKSKRNISRKQVIRTDTAALSGLELEVTSGEAAPHRTQQRNNPRFGSYEGLCRLQKRFSFKKAKLATMYFLQALINLLPPRWPRWGTLDVSVKAFVTSCVLVFWLGLG